MIVPFNEPFLPAGSLKIALNSADLLRTQGKYYEGCKKLITQKLGFKNIILTSSCTSALELIALSINIQPGDEVILPSYTYVSTANAFVLRGAKLVFIDTYASHPSMDIGKIEKAITKRTKAIVVVHYGGIALDYKGLQRLKKKYNIPLVEDAAHCLGSKSGKNFIGSVGDFAAFSFHETKNISCGQGGAAIINNPAFWDRANVIAQCGTDKIDFISKKVKFYSWKNLGSNFLLAEPLCAILSESLKLMKDINQKRMSIWKKYHQALVPLSEDGLIQLPPYDLEGNGHIFYMLTKDKKTRTDLIKYLKAQGIETTFHYFPLHLSSYYLKNGAKAYLKNTEYISDRLIRLPLFYRLTNQQQDLVIKNIRKFFSKLSDGS